jgi:hypothetical protein
MKFIGKVAWIEKYIYICKNIYRVVAGSFRQAHDFRRGKLAAQKNTIFMVFTIRFYPLPLQRYLFIHNS